MTNTTTVGYCKDCAWWSSSLSGGEWGVCELAHLGKDEPAHPESLAIADAEWNGDLKTRANFGCVQWTHERSARLRGL